jgi:hypothetical protein
MSGYSNTRNPGYDLFSFQQSPFGLYPNFILVEARPVTIDLSDTFKPHPALASEVVDGEVVLLHLDDGIYYGLDAIGTQTWQRLSAGDSLGSAIAACVARFPLEPPLRIEADLLALTQTLVDSRLLLRVSQPVG